MSHQFAEIMFTDSVKAAQEQNGSRARLERFAEMSGPNDELTEREARFIAQRDLGKTDDEFVKSAQEMVI